MNVHPQHHGWTRHAAFTLIELLALVFVIAVSIEVGRYVADRHGTGAGIVGGFVSAVLCATAVVIFYWAVGRQHKQRRRELREKYRSIYRVIALPADPSKIQKPEGAEIRIGDYGWEAEPRQDDGLIYLQGLSPEWRVVWYAGFTPDQIEYVCAKPRSQYDWDYSWERNPPLCPFPVQARATVDLGLPTIRMARWLKK